MGGVPFDGVIWFQVSTPPLSGESLTYQASLAGV